MVFKRLEGRDEPIVDPDLPIVDSHHHLFQLAAHRYMFEDYLDDLRAGHNVVASVYVETRAFARTDGPEVLRPIGEIEFANGVGAMSSSGVYGSRRVAAAIVGYADLRFGKSVGALLDQSMARAPERYRGIRQVTMDHPSEAAFRHVMAHRPPAGVLSHPQFRDGFRQVARRGLVFDAAIYSQQLDDIGALADSFDATQIVLNHAGMVMMVDLDETARRALFDEWREGIRRLARRPNVACKIGGFGMPFWCFGFDTRSAPASGRELAQAWKPWIETCIEAFGVDRCMFESNFPPDARSCGFVPLWNAFKHAAAKYSSDERSALFSRTAARIYRIDLADIEKP